MVAQIQTARDYKLVSVSSNPVSNTQGAVQGIVQIFTAPDRLFYVDVIAQALRLGGQGTSVLIAQFFKGGIHQGVRAPRRLGQNLEWLRSDLSRNIAADTELTARETQAVLEMWAYVKHLIMTDSRKLVILDELNLAMARSLISESEIIDTLKSRPQKLDIILTGANMPDSLINIADQVTQRRR